MASKRKQTTKKAARKPGKKVGPVNIGLEFYLPPDLPMLYSDNINVIHTPSEFTISFMQAQPPLLTSDKQWEDVKIIPSRCVARIVVSPMKLELMIRTLSANFQTYVNNYLQQETDDGSDDTKVDAGQS
jgi:hypothetical protein